MDGYHVIEVIVIPYPRLGKIIYIISNEDIAYHVTIGDILHYTCLDITKYKVTTSI